jgi:hypothetical protein
MRSNANERKTKQKQNKTRLRDCSLTILSQFGLGRRSRDRIFGGVHYGTMVDRSALNGLYKIHDHMVRLLSANHNSL